MRSNELENFKMLQTPSTANISKAVHARSNEKDQNFENALYRATSGYTGLQTDVQNVQRTSGMTDTQTDTKFTVFV